MSQTLRERLTGGLKRSLGEVGTIVAEVLRQPELIAELGACLRAPKHEVRERAANALKKIAAVDPVLLQPIAHAILQAWKTAVPLTMRWNLTLVVGKLRLKPRERALVCDLFFETLESKSSLERTFAMQALADLAAGDDMLRTRVCPLFAQLTEHGTAAMQARGRKLLRQLSQYGTGRKASAGS